MGYLLAIRTGRPKRYRIASGGYVVTVSEATFRKTRLEAIGISTFTADIIDAPPPGEHGPASVPNLLGAAALAEIGAIINVAAGVLQTKAGKEVQTEKRGRRMIVQALAWLKC